MAEWGLVSKRWSLMLLEGHKLSNSPNASGAATEPWLCWFLALAAHQELSQEVEWPVCHVCYCAGMVALGS